MTNALHQTLFAPHEGADTPFIHRPDGSIVTHGAFLRLSAQMARALVSLGIAPGDRVALQAEKSVEALAVYAACVRAGAVFLPLNPAYTPDEVAYFLEDSGAKLLIAAPERQERLREIAQSRGAAFQTLDGPAGSFSDLASREGARFAPTPRRAEDLAALLYTSGTTGRSKGAMLTGENLASNARVLVDYWRFTAEDVLLHALPIFHTHGLFVACNVTLVAGGSMIFLPKFEAGEVVRLLPHATSMMGVPTFYTRLLDDARLDRDLVGHMRLFVSGSAPLLAETHRLFEERTGHRILERYGMTETNMSTSNPYDGERRAGTVGFPLPEVELRVIGPNGAELPQGEIGIIEVRGPNVFKGYWGMPEKTAEELRPDGWFITGDLGLVDPDGYVQIVGRNKDLIISGGLNVYPKEVELLLDEQPGVKESAVIGVPHPDFGEAVLAVLVPAGDREPDLEAIGEALGRSLARFKQPKRFELVDELPRNTMGKVQKAALRERYAGAFR